MSDEEIQQEEIQQEESMITEREYSDEEMHALIDGTITDFDEGDLVSGTIVQVERDEVLLDIGYKSEGVIPARELSIRKDADPKDIVTVGDSVEALVLQKEDKDGRLILSKKRAEYERAWVNVEEKFNSGENVEGEVIEVVKGGLILDIGLRGFLPASLVDLRRVKDLNSYLQTRLECRVIEMDRNRNNVVLSRRVVLEEGRKTERQAILTKLVKGQILPGAVSSIVDFGAFVDLGGIDGLVHISELSWSHVNHPSEVVQVGDQVEVKVLDVDLDRERISLGLKQTTDDPLHQVAKKFPMGVIVPGKITKLVPFGVFVEIDEGVEGLVHISEMAEGHVEVPEDIVRIGDEVQVKVMDIDMDRRRISLSMRAAAKDLGIVIEVPEKPGAEDMVEEADEAADEAVIEAEVAEEFAEEAVVEAAVAEIAAEDAVEAAVEATGDDVEPAVEAAEDAIAKAEVAEEAAVEAAEEAAEAEDDAGEAVAEAVETEDSALEEAIAEAVSEAIAEELAEEPAVAVAEELADAAAKEPAEEPEVAAAKESAEEPAVAAAEEPADAAAEEPAVAAAEELAEKPKGGKAKKKK